MKELNLQKIQNKLRNKFLNSGVKMLGPETIFFSNDTKIGKNVTIEPYVVIGKNVKIGNNVIIKSFSHLESCKIENKVEIGPYARIRPDTILKEGSKIGNFVEVKKSIVGKKSKVNHLSYIGDSEIGKSVNPCPRQPPRGIAHGNLWGGQSPPPRRGSLQSQRPRRPPP